MMSLFLYVNFIVANQALSKTIESGKEAQQRALATSHS